MSNKAHSTVVNRLIARYQGTRCEQGPIDVSTAEWLIAVETTATLHEALPQLLMLAGTRYIAVTNLESLTEALRLATGTPLGVMNAQGEIIKPAEVS